MSGNLVIIDGNSIVCRAFFGGPKDQVGPDGQNVGTVSTFVEMLWRILGADELGNPTHIACVFDGGGRNHRHELFPAYKANRGPKPEGLIDQIMLCEQAANLMQLAIFREGGVEADDLIATLAWNAKQQGMSASIVSVDKDFLQLVDDGITLFDPRAAEWRHITETDVIAEWGVYPRQMIDYQAIAGDTADNVPGVKGIGPKTIVNLLREFGTLEAIYEDTSKTGLKGAAKLKLDVGRENAFISKQLVTLRRDMPLPNMMFDDLHIRHVQPGKELLDFLDGLELPSLRGKIARKLGYMEEAA
jgi:DNA polymerase-1